MRKLATIFEINDYMLSANVEPITNGLQFTLIIPATLWSQQVLALRGQLRNDYEAKVVAAWMRLRKLPVKYSTRVEQGTQIVHTFTWPAGLIA